VEDGLRRVPCGRDFVAWALDRLALNGRTTLLASATITPSVEPIFLAHPPAEFLGASQTSDGSFFGSPVTPRFCEEHAGVRRLPLALNAQEQDGAIGRGIQTVKDNPLKRAWGLPKSGASVFSSPRLDRRLWILRLELRHSGQGLRSTVQAAKHFI
jgi:hypothetical protein